MFELDEPATGARGATRQRLVLVLVLVGVLAAAAGLWSFCHLEEFAGVWRRAGGTDGDEAQRVLGLGVGRPLCGGADDAADLQQHRDHEVVLEDEDDDSEVLQERVRMRPVGDSSPEGDRDCTLALEELLKEVPHVGRGLACTLRAWLRLWQTLTDRVHDHVKGAVQPGDDVYVVRNFTAPGRFYDSADISVHQRGVVEKMVESIDKTGAGVVVRFEDHPGTYILRGELLDNVESPKQARTRERVGVALLVLSAILLGLLLAPCLAAALRGGRVV